MKLGQLIKNSVIFFIENYSENETRKLVPDLFIFYKSFKQGKKKYSSP